MNVWKKVVIVLCALTVLGIIICIVPLTVCVVTTVHILPVDTESQWIGFWGNYLGALIGGTISGAITLYVMLSTIKENRKELNEQRITDKEMFEQRFKYDKALKDSEIKNLFSKEILEETINFCSLLTQCTLSEQAFLGGYGTSSIESQIVAVRYENELNAKFIELTTKLRCSQLSNWNIMHDQLYIIKEIMETFKVKKYNATGDEQSEKKKQLNDMRGKLGKLQQEIAKLNDLVEEFYKVNFKYLLE